MTRNQFVKSLGMLTIAPQLLKSIQISKLPVTFKVAGTIEQHETYLRYRNRPGTQHIVRCIGYENGETILEFLPRKITVCYPGLTEEESANRADEEFQSWLQNQKES